MITIWLAFILLILVLLALDLGVFHRTAHAVSVREALVWTGIWVAFGLVFSIFIYFGYENHWLGMGNAVDPVDGLVNDGTSAVIKYLTGYVIEKSLSIDNIFVIAMIFGFLGIPTLYQHRVLFWGILGALVLRGIMIVIGAELIARYHWVLYLFGAFLLITAVKMLFITSEGDPAQNFVVRWIKKHFPFTDQLHGQKFMVRAGSPDVPNESVQSDPKLALLRTGTLVFTPLTLALVLVETTDLIFAVDSIPAIFAITADPFLVFTSNVFAILGLRSLYFALAGMMDKFRYLKISLAIVLAIVGLKMLLAEQLKESLGHGFNLYLLGTVLIVLVSGVLGSLWNGPKLDK